MIFIDLVSFFPLFSSLLKTEISLKGIRWRTTGADNNWTVALALGNFCRYPSLVCRAAERRLEEKEEGGSGLGVIKLWTQQRETQKQSATSSPFRAKDLNPMFGLLAVIVQLSPWIQAANSFAIRVTMKDRWYRRRKWTIGKREFLISTKGRAESVPNKRMCWSDLKKTGRTSSIEGMNRKTLVLRCQGRK